MAMAMAMAMAIQAFYNRKNCDDQRSIQSGGNGGHVWV